MWDDYEEAILARQEGTWDDCVACEHRENCHSQCEIVDESTDFVTWWNSIVVKEA